MASRPQSESFDDWSSLMNELIEVLTVLSPIDLVCLALCLPVLHEGCNQRAVKLIEAMR
jgi:hypothetical protein